MWYRRESREENGVGGQWIREIAPIACGFCSKEIVTDQYHGKRIAAIRFMGICNHN